MTVGLLDLSAIPADIHESRMLLAIEEAGKNPLWPFGAVIVRAHDGAILARGVNQAVHDPTRHGEMVALDNHLRAHGRDALSGAILYTTAEPCPMCMGALIWAGLGGIVFGTSIGALVELGIDQIMIEAADLRRRASFYRGGLLGGVLAAQTDEMFRRRLEPAL